MRLGGRRRNLEESYQITVKAWFNAKYRGYKDYLMHIPNGQNVGAARGKQLRKMGLVAGYPDLALFLQTKDHAALFIEMKTESGVVSANQKDIHQLLKDAGYKVEVCKSVDAAISVLESYMECHLNAK